MIVEVSGVYKKVVRKGIWLLSKSEWTSTSFDWCFDTEKDPLDTPSEATAGLKLSVSKFDDKFVLNARLRGVQFVLGEANPDESKVTNFAIQSVARTQLQGAISWHEIDSVPEEWKAFKRSRSRRRSKSDH
jgi:hypothetical protein